jgi:hypothetical protein
MIRNQDDGSINYPLVRKEMTLLKMDTIISELLLKHRFVEDDYRTRTGSDNSILLNRGNDLKTPPEALESYRFIKNWILEVLSTEALKDLYEIAYVNSDRFKFKHDKIIRYHVDYANNLERFEFQSVVYRNNKEHNFFVYFDIIFDNKYIKYYINQIIILGINIEQKIVFSDYLDKDYKLDENGVHLSLSKANPGYVTDQYINNYRKTTEEYVQNDVNSRKQANQLNMYGGRCFFKNAYDKNECISYTPEGGVGIWDTPCKYNEECPFYKKNTNYPNNRGGCVDGFCEMPVNVGLLGYKEYNESDKPICYNCDPIQGCTGIGCSQCCDEQRDTKHYPNLSSPDYAFPNDYTDRMDHKSSFVKKDMAPVMFNLG